MTAERQDVGYVAELRQLASGLELHAQRARDRGIHLLATQLTTAARDVRSWADELAEALDGWDEP